MRRPAIFFLTIVVCLIFFAIRSVFTLLTLLVEDASADAIHSAEIPAPNSPLIEGRPQLIPKIIHQTYVNDSVPEHWREAQKSCLDLHGDYEYKVYFRFQIQARPLLWQPLMLTLFLTALDRRQIPRPNSNRIPLVSRDLRRLPTAHPTCRRDSLLRPRPLRRRLHRPRRRLQPTPRSPPLLPKLAPPHKPHRHLQ